MLLSTAYFPPIEWFALIARDFDPRQGLFSVVYLDAHEHFCKQSWRNRCCILSAGGRLSLSFPVCHGENLYRTPISEVRVDYSTPWVNETKTAISSAYYSSPYFEYYKDELFAILDSKPETLWELNLRIINFFLQKTGILANIVNTSEFVPYSSPEQSRGSLYGEDYREAIHPKRGNTILRDMGLKKPYWQVFSDKYGFTDSLSIMDLLFNEGPDSIMYLYSFPDCLNLA